MADSKVSELTAATSAAAADTIYLVQSGASKSITNAALFGAIATPAVFNDKISIGDHDTITAAGALNLTTNVTWINDVSAAGTCTLAAGSDGQIKIIIMSSNSGGHTVTLSNSNTANSISFSSAGHSATLLYDTGLAKWYFIGGTATVA
jgi:uncharacterized protein (UPF0333 family)|tara:strand:- start:717 stop:1163 length:447 start_codon:yes stop_codon:yes gene_type:complete